MSPAAGDANVRRFHDPVIGVGEYAFFALMALVARRGARDAGVHGDCVVRVGTLVAVCGAVGAGCDGGHVGGYPDEEGAERRKGAEDENQPAFY